MAVTFPPQPQDEKKWGIFTSPVSLERYSSTSLHRCQSICLPICLFSAVVLVLYLLNDTDMAKVLIAMFQFMTQRSFLHL